LFFRTIAISSSWLVKEILLKEIDGGESETYKLLWDYIQRIKLADPTAWMKFEGNTENHFAAIFITPSACRNAVRNTRGYFGFDATYTRSKYPNCSISAVALIQMTKLFHWLGPLYQPRAGFGGIGFASNMLLTSLVTSTVS
jgi:hypothetical protein